MPRTRRVAGRGGLLHPEAGCKLYRLRYGQCVTIAASYLSICQRFRCLRIASPTRLFARLSRNTAKSASVSILPRNTGLETTS